MRLRVDDDIYRVDGVWLGPPRRTLPWRARYVAYGIGLLIFFVLQVVERRVGITITFWSLAYSLLATVALTRLALTVVDHDRTVWSVVMAFVHEVGAPRLDERARTTSWRPARVRRKQQLPRRLVAGRAALPRQGRAAGPRPAPPPAFPELAERRPGRHEWATSRVLR